MGPVGPQGLEGPPGTGAADTGDTTITVGDVPDFPVLWVSMDPPSGEYASGSSAEITVTLKVPPGAQVELHFFNPVSGTDSSRRPDIANADADGNIVLKWIIHENAAVGEATMQVTVTKTDGTSIIVDHPYILK